MAILEVRDLRVRYARSGPEILRGVSFSLDAEEFCAKQQVTIPHPVLLTDGAGLQSILDAVAKIKAHAEELLEPVGAAR